MADTNPNPNLSPCVTHQPSLLGGAENMKVLFDEELDNRRETLARQRAWEAITLDMAQTASRRAQNAATFDHAVNAGLVLSARSARPRASRPCPRLVLLRAKPPRVRLPRRARVTS